MPALDLRVLVLERWRRQWEDDGGSGGSGGTVTVGGITPVTPLRLLGRYSPGSGPAQEITPGTGLLLQPDGLLVNTGVPGPVGPAGPIGAQGEQGVPGPPGSQGATGPQGDTGAQGPQGPTGATGSQGPPGATGSQGPQGPAGPTGPQGDTGAQGPQGIQGATGATGSQGPQGVPGPEGPEGDQGIQGPQGVQGPQGETGPQGPPGSVSGAGVANKVAVWNAATTQSYHTNLHYDLSTQRFGIGGVTPTGALDVQGSVVASDLANRYVAVRAWPTAPSGATEAHGMRIEATTGAALATASHYGLTVRNQPTTSGFSAALNLEQNAGTNRYNVYAGGPAQNYFFGPVGIGVSANVPAYPLDVSGQVRASALTLGGHAPTGVLDVQGSVVASDVANWYFGLRLWPLAPSGAVGVQGMRIEPPTGAAISTAGFYGIGVINPPVSSGTVNAAYFDVAAGANRWNVFAGGTAQNYFAGNVGIGHTTPTAPLTFAATVGPKVHFYNTGVAGQAYGASISSGSLDLFAEAAGRIDLGVLTSSAFAPMLRVNGGGVQLLGPLGAGYAPDPSYGIRAGACLFDWLGVGLVLSANHELATNRFYAAGASWFNSTLTVYGALSTNGQLLMHPGYGATTNGFTDGGTYARCNCFSANPNWGSTASFWLEHIYGSRVHFGMYTAYQYVNIAMSGGNHTTSVGAWVDAPSDRRLKTGITPIDNPLGYLRRIQGCYYDRMDLPTVPGMPPPKTTEYGLIAQEVGDALPEAAFEHDYGRDRGVFWNYTDRPVLALLVEAVKALLARVEVLEAR